MAKSPFEAFPPGFRPLLDKLPEPDGDGLISLEGHWWRQDRDKIAEAVAVLGWKLKFAKRGIDLAREAGDLAAVRGGIVKSLVKIQEALMPIVGIDQVWVVGQAIDALETAGQGKRHVLSALRGDPLHTRRDAPYRMMIQSLAAAILDFFDGRIEGSTQADLGAKVAKALAAGGFRVSSRGSLSNPSVRSLQHWRSQCLPGSRVKPPHAKMREMFGFFTAQLQAKQNGLTPDEFLKVKLSELESHARDGQTVFET